MTNKLIRCFLVMCIGCGNPTDSAKKYDPAAKCVVGTVGYCIIGKIPYLCDSDGCLPIIFHPSFPMIMLNKTKPSEDDFSPYVVP